MCSSDLARREENEVPLPSTRPAALPSNASSLARFPTRDDSKDVGGSWARRKRVTGVLPIKRGTVPARAYRRGSEKATRRREPSTKACGGRGVRLHVRASWPWRLVVVSHPRSMGSRSTQGRCERHASGSHATSSCGHQQGVRPVTCSRARIPRAHHAVRSARPRQRRHSARPPGPGKHRRPGASRDRKSVV